MVLPNILHRANGFTIIEILVAVAILTAIFGLGLFLSFDFYKSYAARAEKNVVISVLQKARSQAMDNINQTKHGVHFSESPLTYTLFEGSSYNPINPTNLAITASYGITVTSPALPLDVIFDQLSGEVASSPITITLSEGTTITINDEGRISW